MTWTMFRRYEKLGTVWMPLFKMMEMSSTQNFIWKPLFYLKTRFLTLKSGFEGKNVFQVHWIKCHSIFKTVILSWHPNMPLVFVKNYKFDQTWLSNRFWKHSLFVCLDENEPSISITQPSKTDVNQMARKSAL